MKKMKEEGINNTIEFPENPDIPVWRYMSFPKFMDVISSHSIFFARADRFTDNYEGFINTALKKRISVDFDEYDNAKEIRDNLNFQLKSLKESTLINCWNMSDTDSLGMWNTYCSEDEGIAIRSNIKRLTKSVIGEKKDSFHIRPVKYLDIEKSDNFDANAINLFTFKRLQFSFENELRIILPYAFKNGTEVQTQGKSGLVMEPYDYGKNVRIDFSILAEEIYIAPNAPDWFVRMVKRIVGVMYDIPIKKSEINKKP